MSTRATPPTAAELAEEASALAFGGGLITMALFPLALPIILLTAAAAIPLLLLGLAVAPIFLLRRLLRTIRVSPPESRSAEATGRRAHAVT